MKTVYLDWNEKPFEVVSEFAYKEYELYVLHEEGDYNNSFRVVSKSNCMNKEDTKIYKKKKEIEELVVKKQEKIQEIQDEAIKSLSSRIRINIAFGSSVDTNNLISLKIVEELEKIIKDKNI